MRNLLSTSIVLLTSLLVIVSCKSQGTKNIFLIPKEFTGIVIVVFDQKDGKKPGIENGKTVFRIPASGILKTQVKPYYENISNEYYFIDSLQIKTPIKYLFSFKAKPSAIEKEVYCFDEQMASTPINKPNIKTIRTFLVGNSNQADSLYNILNNKIFEEGFGLK